MMQFGLLVTAIMLLAIFATATIDEMIGNRGNNNDSHGN